MALTGFILIILTELISGSASSSNIPKLMNSEDLIKSYGYPAEKFQVETDDGYILTLFRIPSTGTPVLMIPGLFSTTDVFTLFNESLAYQLSKNGNDVWLGNVRGEFHSRAHKTLQPTDEKFWDFNLDDLALHDLPVMINFIVNKTEQQKINFVGYSGGTSMFFIMASEKPEMMEKIKLIVAIAPVYTLQRYSFFVQEDGEAYSFLQDQYDNFVKEKKVEAFPRMDTPYSDLQYNCTHAPEELASYCDIDRVKVDFGDWLPAGTSIHVAFQFLQSISKGILSRFDYGKEKNQKVYNQETVPELNLKKMTIPTYIIHSEGDEILDANDIEEDVKVFPNLALLHKIDSEEFTHSNYIHINKPSVEKDFYKMVDIIKNAVK